MQFKLLNTPVVIQPTFWWFLLFFCLNPQLAPTQMGLLALVFFLSLLFHEYGHALAAQKCGKPSTITLEAVGGYCSYDPIGLSERHQLFITLCGPLFTGILVALPYYLLKAHWFDAPAVNLFLHYMMSLNTFWLIVNAAPLYPLDGGKIFGYFLRKYFGQDRGWRLSLLLGNITAACGAVYFLTQHSFIFAYIFLFYGWQNFQIWTKESKKEKPTPSDLYNRALEALKNNEKQKARMIFAHLSKSKDPRIQTQSIENLAHLLESEGKTDEAYRILLRADHEQLSTGKQLLCKLAYTQKNYQLVERFSRDIYTLFPTLETAMLNAKTFSQLGQISYAIGWINTAIQFQEAKQYPLSELLADPALDPLRDHPKLKEILDTSSEEPAR